MRTISWMVGLVAGLVAFAPTRSHGFATPQLGVSGNYTGPSFYYLQNELMSVYLQPVGSANYDLYVDRSTDGTTWTLVASSATGGSGVVESIRYRATSSAYLRFRIVRYSDPYGQGATFTMGSELAATAVTSFSANAPLTFGPSINPDSGFDAKINIKNSSGTVLWSANTYGAGGTEFGTYTTTCSNCTTSFEWVKVSGTGMMRVSFNMGRGNGQNWTNTYSTVSTKANNLKTKIQQAVNKFATNDGSKEYQFINMVRGWGNSLTTSCDWQYYLEPDALSQLKDIQKTEDRTRSVGGSVSLMYTCAGELKLSGSFSASKWFCVYTTACICGIDVSIGAFVEGDLGGSGDSSAQAGINFDAGMHCGLHVIACGYAGGFIKVGYELEYKSGVPNHYFVFEPGVTWHATLASFGPSGTLSYEKRIPIF